MSRSRLAPALIACLAAYGAHLVYTSLALRWNGVMPGPRARQTPARRLAIPQVTGLSVRAAAVGAAASARCARPLRRAATGGDQRRSLHRDRRRVSADGAGSETTSHRLGVARGTRRDGVLAGAGVARFRKPCSRRDDARRPGSERRLPLRSESGRRRLTSAEHSAC